MVDPLRKRIINSWWQSATRCEGGNANSIEQKRFKVQQIVGKKKTQQRFTEKQNQKHVCFREQWFFFNTYYFYFYFFKWHISKNRGIVLGGQIYFPTALSAVGLQVWSTTTTSSSRSAWRRLKPSGGLWKKPSPPSHQRLRSFSQEDSEGLKSAALSDDTFRRITYLIQPRNRKWILSFHWQSDRVFQLGSLLSGIFCPNILPINVQWSIRAGFKMEINLY